MVDSRRRQILTALSTGAILGTGTASGTTNINDTSNAEQENYQPPDQLRFIHASVDTPPIEFAINGTPVTRRDTVTMQPEYVRYDPGRMTVSATNTKTGETVFEATDTLDGGSYSLILIGESCDLSEKGLAIHAFQDDLSPVEDNQSRIRAINAIPDAPTADIVSDGEVLMDAIGFGKGKYATIEPGNRVLEIRSDDDNSEVERFAIEPEPGGIYTGIGVGYVDRENAPSAAVRKKPGLAIIEDFAPDAEN